MTEPNSGSTESRNDRAESSEVAGLRDAVARLQSAGEEKNRRIRDLENEIYNLNTIGGTRTYKQRNAVLNRQCGLSLRAFMDGNVEEAIRLLGDGLRLDDELIREVTDRALDPNRGRNPDNEQGRAYPRLRNRRKRVRPERRSRILERDGHKCVSCGHPGDQKNHLTIDHIVPIANGGTNNDDNLQTLCLRCNLRKNERLMPPT